MPLEKANLQELKASEKELKRISFQIYQIQLETCVIKVKKIACKSLKEKGVNSRLRLIYALFKVEQKITFIEIYHKNDKDSED